MPEFSRPVTPEDIERLIGPSPLRAPDEDDDHIIRGED